MARVFFRSILLKSLRDYRWGMFWWSLGTFAIIFFVIGLYPSFKDSAAQLNQLYQSSDEVMALVGQQDLSTSVGFLSQEIFSMVAPMFVIIYGISLGAGAIAREEGRGTLALLLANPVSRRRVIYEKFAAMKIALLVVSVVFFASIAGLGPSFEMGDLDLVKLAMACLMTFLIGLAFGAITFCVGAVTGNRGVTIGVASAAALGMYLLYVMERLVDSLEPYRWLSLFYYYAPDKVLAEFPSVEHFLVLVGVSVVGFALSLLAFRQRDIQA